MAYKDGENFKTYCDKPYDKHVYRIEWKDGSRSEFDNYEIMRYVWYQNRHMAECVHILDCTSGKGF